MQGSMCATAPASLLRRRRSAAATSRAVVAVLLVTCLAATLSCALSTEIGAGENFKITEALAAGRDLHFQFALHPDFVFPISIVDHETNEELMRWKDLQHGAFSIAGSDKPRVLVISFDNSNTLFTTKFVNFDLRSSLSVDYAVDASQLDPIEQKVRVLSSAMQRLKTLQVSIRTQQKDHRATVEDANERVLLWSIFQVVAFLGMSGFQLFLLKRFLEKKTYI